VGKLLTSLIYWHLVSIKIYYLSSNQTILFYTIHAVIITQASFLQHIFYSALHLNKKIWLYQQIKGFPSLDMLCSDHNTTGSCSPHLVLTCVGSVFTNLAPNLLHSPMSLHQFNPPPGCVDFPGPPSTGAIDKDFKSYHLTNLIFPHKII